MHNMRAGKPTLNAKPIPQIRIQPQNASKALSAVVFEALVLGYETGFWGA